MAEKHRTIPLTRRGFDFEIFMWSFTRFSALVMYLCALTGLVGALILGARSQVNLADLIRWTFMPNANHVLMNTTLNNISNTDVWEGLFWKIMGSTFIFFAASHGLHGLLSVVEDYLKNVSVRRILRLVVLLLTFAMITIAIYVLWTA